EGLLAESAAYSSLQAGPEFAAWRAAHPARQRDDRARRVRVEREGDLLHITLTRAEARNALDTAMRDQLVDALLLAAADDSIAQVHLRGEGPSFCAGGDLDEFGSRPDPATAHLVRMLQSAGRAIHVVGARVTAHVHGACRGSGVELPAFAGRVVATPDATFGLPEVSLGLIPGAGGTVSVTRRVGRHRTALLALTGDAVDTATALEWGLVDEITT
ncbi:MAG: enoyl-CoA hydratase/isomerase family protein, partial [Acidimicrobiales bacterium]